MKKIVTFGEVMLRLATPGYLRFGQAQELTATYGGEKPMSPYPWHIMGWRVQYVTRLPENDIAEACLADLHRHGVKTDHVIRGGERIGNLFPRNRSRSPSEQSDIRPAHSAIAEIKPGMIDWERILEGLDWFHWTGITPAISQGAAEVCWEAINSAKRMGVPVSCDLNYRKNLWKYGKTASEVMPELVSGCNLILGNEEDAEKVFGIKPEGFDATRTGGAVDAARFESVCRQLMLRFPEAKKVVITLRGSVNANHNTWGGVLFDGKTLYQSARYDITHIVDRVGGGDASWAACSMACLPIRRTTSAHSTLPQLPRA